MSYKHILLIDDDDDDQEIFLSAMEELEFSVMCTVLSSAESALSKLETKQTIADLIFLDLNMPIMNGKQFLKEIMKNEELRHIPVIVFSTSSQQETIQETKKLGAHDFITKPTKFSDLKNILKSIIG
jgi:CheY-like chemotaxis protein